ncbi:hypothetical protein [Chitinophaga sp. LS1]|uniref:hypothetical protein n=1 Tax=Chitinophaga sp. LS1 TaxID=3051176 RepID=UPI002AAAB849|nr:hypothetical protein [Chitinophaga sp. LS1]WPV64473.1 hypothetical protein QQL36_21970 [Chitinophaga sp. LS1]
MAVGYATGAMADPEKKALYQAGADGSRTASAYNLAVKDAINPPEMKELKALNYKGEIGDKLPLHVKDVVEVASVEVSIVIADGTLVETGQTVKFYKFCWQYTTTAANHAVNGSKVNVVATDLADNETVVDFIV